MWATRRVIRPAALRVYPTAAQRVVGGHSYWENYLVKLDSIQLNRVWDHLKRFEAIETSSKKNRLIETNRSLKLTRQPEFWKRQRWLQNDSPRNARGNRQYSEQISNKPVALFDRLLFEYMAAAAWRVVMGGSANNPRSSLERERFSNKSGLVCNDKMNNDTVGTGRALFNENCTGYFVGSLFSRKWTFSLRSCFTDFLFDSVLPELRLSEWIKAMLPSFCRVDW